MHRAMSVPETEADLKLVIEQLKRSKIDLTDQVLQLAARCHELTAQRDDLRALIEQVCAAPAGSQERERLLGLARLHAHGAQCG